MNRRDRAIKKEGITKLRGVRNMEKIHLTPLKNR